MLYRTLCVAAALCSTVLISACQSYVPRADLAEEYYNLGNAYFSLERYEEAEQYYRRALSLSPSLERANYNLARTLVVTQNYQQAIALLQELLATDAENVRVTETLAYAQLSAGNREEAIRLYERVLELSPYRVTALFNLGLLARDNGRPRRAVDLLERARGAASEDMEILYHLGMSYLEIDESEEGAAALGRYLSESEDPPISRLMTVAAAFEESRFYARALDGYDAVLQREANNAEALFGTARVLLTGAEEGTRGLERLSQALESGFSDEEVILELLHREDLIRRDAVRETLSEHGLVPAEEPAGGQDDRATETGSDTTAPESSEQELRPPDGY